ncbi:MAG: zinc ribbon domain-containing protein, partial [Cyanobacteria bacterium J06629_18]
DMGFYEIRRQLEYKCKLYGSKLVVVDRWFPSSKTCSNCGHKKEVLSLSERVFECESFICTIDRDLNAAINLSHCGLGVSRHLLQPRKPCTSAVAPQGSQVAYHWLSVRQFQPVDGK